MFRPCRIINLKRESLIAITFQTPKSDWGLGFGFGIWDFAIYPSRVQQIDAIPALTRLSQDEALFRDSVYKFADREIRPHVREMDEHAKIPPELIASLFDLGVMGIEIPESHGGAGATFFHSVLAVEALSRVDPSIGVFVDERHFADRDFIRYAPPPNQLEATCRGASGARR